MSRWMSLSSARTTVMSGSASCGAELAPPRLDLPLPTLQIELVHGRAVLLQDRCGRQVAGCAARGQPTRARGAHARAGRVHCLQGEGLGTSLQLFRSRAIVPSATRAAHRQALSSVAVAPPRRSIHRGAGSCCCRSTGCRRAASCRRSRAATCRTWRAGSTPARRTSPHPRGVAAVDAGVHRGPALRRARRRAGVRLVRSHARPPGAHGSGRGRQRARAGAARRSPAAARRRHQLRHHLARRRRRRLLQRRALQLRRDHHRQDRAQCLRQAGVDGGGRGHRRQGRLTLRARARRRRLGLRALVPAHPLDALRVALPLHAPVRVGGDARRLDADARCSTSCAACRASSSTTSATTSTRIAAAPTRSWRCTTCRASTPPSRASSAPCAPCPSTTTTCSSSPTTGSSRPSPSRASSGAI